MKKITLIIAFALMGLSAANQINAQTVIGTWTSGATTCVLTDDSVFTISGSGAMADYNWNNVPWYSNKMDIKTLVIGDSVTTIGGSAFYDCSRLSGTLTIPNSVTIIGNAAFYDCSRLSGALTIPNSVTTIGEDAFAYCSGLNGALTLSNSVTTIGEDAFAYCSGLSGALTIPNSVTTIGGSAFSGCSGLNGALTLSNSVMNISRGAFRGCSGLNGALTIPNSVTTIGGSAFYSCSGFTSVTIPNSVTTIGDLAFYDCSGLNGALTIPDSITTISRSAFNGCSGLSGALTIPNSVTTIGESAFYRCSGFTSVTIPNSVTTIGELAFYDCRGLSGVLTIPDSITTIGRSTFANCSGLNGALIIPNSVTTIGGSAFSNCIGLTSITCNAVVPPSLGTNVFDSVPNGIPVYVPCRSLNAYQTSWTHFNNFQPLPIDTNFINAAICNGETYSANGFNENTAGVYSRTEQNTNGCDSTITLNLSVYPIADTTFINASITEGETYADNGFNESTAGIYQLILQNANGCDSVIVLNLSVNSVGLTDVEAADLSIYPNPAKDRINFSCSEAIKEIEIFNIVGQQVYVAKVNEKFTALNVAGFAKGSYIAKLHTAKGIVEKKFVVE